jgi:serine/threonine protein phosphatase PrpC
VITATATHVGGREANADAAAAVTNPLGAAIAVVDGIGSEDDTCAAARLAADTAAIVGTHRGALAALLAAADTMPDYDGAPHAVAAVATVHSDRRIEVAHVGDAAVHTWSRERGLTKWTADQTVGAQAAYMGLPPSPLLDRLGDYVLSTLRGASISMVATVVIPDDHPVEVVLVSSDGVHKILTTQQMATIIDAHANQPQALADALVEAAITVPVTGHDDVPDNATVAVLQLHGPRLAAGLAR